MSTAKGRGATAIRAAFDRAKAEGRAALVCYLMGGHPDVARTTAYLKALADGGADVIEVGIPFSDPVADGPTIQNAGVQALAGGTRPSDVLASVAALRADGVETPVVAMTYANIPYTMGWDRYAAALAEAGVDGTIIPDAPVEECEPLRAAMDAHGLANILLAAPLTRDARLQRVTERTQGFLYLVGSFGTTGARTELAPETLACLKHALPAARAADAPLAVGFGVSTPEQVRSLADAGADGIVVGSALVARIIDGASPDEIAAAVRTLAEGLTPIS